MEGALRIERAMVVEDALLTKQVINHLNYLSQVACLAQNNPWQRVFNYDSVYRREQLTHGFQWGSTSTFLLNAHFRTPASDRPHNNHTVNIKPSTQYRNPHSKVMYFNWNGRSGCHRQPLN